MVVGYMLNSVSDRYFIANNLVTVMIGLLVRLVGSLIEKTCKIEAVLSGYGKTSSAFFSL